MKYTQITDKTYHITFESELEKKNFLSYMTTSDSLKAADVMKILDISRVTLCHYVKKGLITIDTNYTGGQYRYNRDSVMALKNKNSIK